MENNLNEQKQPYYVFMDIDGTLWDVPHAMAKHGPFLKVIDFPTLKPSSVAAINLLLETLEERFDTRLVITSRHRENMVACVHNLEFNGFKYNKPIYCTPYIPGPRGQKIVDFMTEQGEKPFTYPTLNNLFSRILYTKKDNNDFKNYVVIDDKKSAIAKQIPPERRIITNLKKESLTHDQVINYLLQNKIPVHIQGEHLQYI